MNIKFRLLTTKIKPLHKIAQIIMYNSGWIFYKKKYHKEGYYELFSKLRDSKTSKRCFIIGNGPSLRAEDLDMLKSEDCFAANGIYNVFSQTTWRPKYYTVMDRYFDASPEKIRDIECEIVFLGDYYWRFNKVLCSDSVCLHEHIGFGHKQYFVSEDISKFVTTAYTVSFVEMQIAAFLGYKEIYLLGFDHNYNVEIDANGNVKKTDNVKSHFFKDNQPNEVVANVEGMTKAYISFRNYAKVHGITIKNATRGGKLEVFERVDFDVLMQKK